MSTAPLPDTVRRLAWSTLAAQSSEQVGLAAAPLVAVLTLAAGGAETGWLQTAQTLPFLLVSLPAGLLADRHSRLRLMWAAEGVRAASLAAMLGLLVAGQLTLPLLAALGFAGAVGTVVYSVAAPALLPALVARDGLARANRWLELARSAAFAAGPAIGGALVAWTGAPAAFALATVLSLTALLLLVGLPDGAPAPARPDRRIVQDLAEGAAFVASHALLRPILVTSVIFNTSWFLLQAVYVVYAVERLGLTAAGIGASLAAYGAGMLGGAWAAPLLGRHVPFGVVVASGPVSALGGALLMLLTLAIPSGIVAGAAFVLFGAGPILWVITTTTLRQAVTPNALLGRVSATILMATAGARPLGAALGAILAATLGIEACLVAAAGGFALQVATILTSPVPRLPALPQPV